MPDDVTFQTTLATPPSGFIVRTVEIASGAEVQVVLVGASQTCTTTSVGDSATSVTLLSADTDRLGVTLFNNSPSACYVKMGTTASASDFNIKMSPGGYYEVPFGYQGRIDAMWVTDAGGAMLIGAHT